MPGTAAIRAGRAADFFPIRPPYVPGNGIAGRVTSLGEGVDSGWLGRAVMAHTGGPGGYAEQAADAHAALESRTAVAKTLLRP